MKVFYFTSTGNNLYIAKKLGGKLYSIPKVLKKGTLEFEDDRIGIVFPCYYFGTPRIVREFLEKAKLKSGYIFAIMSYGNISAAGVKHFEKTAAGSGIKLSYINDILMVDNYIPVFDMEKQLKKEAAKNIEENLKKILSDIDSKTKHIKKTGLHSSLMTTLTQMYYKTTLGKADKNFIVEDSCNSCRICEMVCPVDNIKVDTKPEFLHHCEECYACTHNCPRNSIRHKKEKSRARFINNHIRMNEIIDSNR
ncbi:EFR1 family ferrodoxin [Elusimicrobiota bacterium]